MTRKKQKNGEGEWTSSFIGESRISAELKKLTSSPGWVAATHKLVHSAKKSPNSSRASTPVSTVSSSSRHSSTKGQKNEKKSKGRPPGKQKFRMVLEKDEEYEIDYVSPDEEFDPDGTTAGESDIESKEENSDPLSDADNFSLDEDDDISSLGDIPASLDEYSDVEMEDDFPPLELPESSLDLLVPNNLLLSALGIYEIFRHFRNSLRLSPMLFEDFCAALIDEDTNILLTECYISVLKALLREDDAAGVLFGPSDQNEQVRVALNFLDHMTWPEVIRSYLESHFTEHADAIEIVRDPKFPSVGVEDKMTVLKTLTDIYLASNKIRDQLMTDGVIHYDDHCRSCHKLGDLLCCETCPAVYHLACCDPPLEEVPDDEWQCEVCVAHKLNGVYNCEPQHELRGQYLRHEPIGTDRHSNKYWFLARRLIIEGQDKVWYYSTQEQFENVWSILDPDKYEMVLCEALKDVAEEFPKYSKITRDVTEEALPDEKDKSYLDILTVRVKRDIEEKKAKEREEKEKRRMEEEERKKKEEEERLKQEKEALANGPNDVGLTQPESDAIAGSPALTSTPGPVPCAIPDIREGSDAAHDATTNNHVTSTPKVEAQAALKVEPAAEMVAPAADKVAPTVPYTIPEIREGSDTAPDSATANHASATPKVEAPADEIVAPAAENAAPAAENMALATVEVAPQPVDVAPTAVQVASAPVVIPATKPVVAPTVVTVASAGTGIRSATTTPNANAMTNAPFTSNSITTTGATVPSKLISTPTATTTKALPLAQKNFQVIKLGQGLQVKTAPRTIAPSMGGLSQLKTLFVLNKDGTKTPIMLGPTGKILAPANKANPQVNRQILVLNSAKVPIPKVNRELKKLQYSGAGPKTFGVIGGQTLANQATSTTAFSAINNSNQMIQTRPKTVTSTVLTPPVEKEPEPPKDVKPLTHEEEAEKYFRLGEDKAYKQYVNHYSENLLALNKYQHREERDRERHLGYKFSMTGEGEFKWMGEAFGNENTIIDTLRSTLMHFEHQIPLCFMHTRWGKYRNAWGKIVMKCNTPQGFAAALGILEMATRAVVKKSVWKDAHGLTRLQRVTAPEKEEFDKRRKQRNRADEEEANRKGVWCKYPIPIKSTMVWKMRGEEYRMNGFGGWVWLSNTRHAQYKPYKPKPYTVVHKMNDAAEAPSPTRNKIASVSAQPADKRDPLAVVDMDTDSEKSTSTTSTTTTKSADFTEDRNVFESLVHEVSNEALMISPSKDSVTSQSDLVSSQTDGVTSQATEKTDTESKVETGKAEDAASSSIIPSSVKEETPVTSQTTTVESDSAVSEQMEVDASSQSTKTDSDIRKTYQHIIDSNDVINVSENLLKRTPLFSKKWAASKVDVLLGWRLMQRESTKQKEVAKIKTEEKEAEPKAVVMKTDDAVAMATVKTKPDPVPAQIKENITTTTDVNRPCDVTMATTTSDPSPPISKVEVKAAPPPSNATDSEEIDIETVNTANNAGTEPGNVAPAVAETSEMPKLAVASAEKTPSAQLEDDNATQKKPEPIKIDSIPPDVDADDVTQQKTVIPKVEEVEPSVMETEASTNQVDECLKSVEETVDSVAPGMAPSPKKADDVSVTPGVTETSQSISTSEALDEVGGVSVADTAEAAGFGSNEPTDKPGTPPLTETLTAADVTKSLTEVMPACNDATTEGATPVCGIPDSVKQAVTAQDDITPGVTSASNATISATTSDIEPDTSTQDPSEKTVKTDKTEKPLAELFDSQMEASDAAATPAEAMPDATPTEAVPDATAVVHDSTKELATVESTSIKAGQDVPDDHSDKTSATDTPAEAMPSCDATITSLESIKQLEEAGGSATNTPSGTTSEPDATTQNAQADHSDGIVGGAATSLDSMPLADASATCLDLDPKVAQAADNFHKVTAACDATSDDATSTGDMPPELPMETDATEVTAGVTTSETVSDEITDTITDTTKVTTTTPDQTVTMVETVTTTITKTTTVNKTIVTAGNDSTNSNGAKAKTFVDVKPINTVPDTKQPVGSTGAILTKPPGTTTRTTGGGGITLKAVPIPDRKLLPSHGRTMVTTIETSRSRVSRMSRVRKVVRRTLDGKTSTTAATWKLQRYRKTTSTIKREQTMKLPIPWKFCADKKRKKSIFRLPPIIIRKLAIIGGLRPFHAGFNYGAKWFSGLEQFWMYPCPRPLFYLVWRYKLQNVCTLASVAHLLRVFWHAIRWDKMTLRPQTDDVVHTVTTDDEIVTTELLKRKDDPVSGLHSEYFVRRITMPLLDPEEEALRAIKPADNYTPSRRGLRSSTRPFSSRDRSKKEGPQVEMVWVPEEKVEMWQIRLFDTMLKEQRQQQLKGASTTSLQTSGTRTNIVSAPSVGVSPTLQNLRNPGINIMKIPVAQAPQLVTSKVKIAQTSQNFMDKKSYNVMVSGKPQVQKIIVQPPGQQFPAYKAGGSDIQAPIIRSTASGTHYIVQGGKLIKPIIIKAASQVVSTPIQQKTIHPTIKLNDGASPVIKFQQQPPPILPTLKTATTPKIVSRSPNQTQIKLSSNQLSQLMKVGVGTQVRVSVSLGNGRTGIGQIQLIPPGSQVTPSTGQQLMQTRVGGELKRFLFTLISESTPSPTPKSPSNEVSLQTASLSQRLQQMQKHSHSMYKRQNTDMKKLLTDKDPLWGSRPQTPERTTFPRRDIDRGKKRPMSREAKEDGQRQNVVIQVMKSILDRIERREDIEMRKKKREEALMKQRERKEQTEQAKVHNYQAQILHRHRDRLKQEILRRRAVVEKYLTHSAKNELREDQRKRRPSTDSTPVSKRPKKTYGNAIVTSAVLTENNAKRPMQGKSQSQQPITTKRRRTTSPPPDNMKQKMISTQSKKSKDRKLYCVCKTPYDPTKFYIGCDLCLNWFHGSCVGIPENRAKHMNEWVCDDCKKVQEDPSQELYCLCRTPYDDSQFYIGCDICQDWYHGTCVGVTEKESEDIDFYSCPRCSKKNKKGKEAAVDENRLTREDYVSLTKIVRSLRAHKMAWPFLQPVSRLEVPNYHKVIKKPMDLGTIMQKLDSYTMLSELVGDVSLIFDNCRMFNGADSALAKCAEIVESVFVGKIREFRAKRGRNK